MATLTNILGRVSLRHGPWELVVVYVGELAVIERMVGATQYLSYAVLEGRAIETWFTYPTREEAELAQALVVLSGYKATIRYWSYR